MSHFAYATGKATEELSNDDSYARVVLLSSDVLDTKFKFIPQILI